MCEIVSTTWEKTNELIDGSAISRTFLLVTFRLDLKVHAGAIQLLSGKESNSAQAPETILIVYTFYSIKISCAITSLVIFNLRFLKKT